MTTKPPSERDLEKMAESSEPGIVAEFVEFLRDNKKWWLIPILVVLALFGVVAALSQTAFAPFIYTLF